MNRNLRWAVVASPLSPGAAIRDYNGHFGDRPGIDECRHAKNSSTEEKTGVEEESLRLGRRVTGSSLGGPHLEAKLGSPASRLPRGSSMLQVLQAVST